MSKVAEQTSAEGRREAIKHLIHSDPSPQLLSEMRAALKDEDGEVRTAALGNLGESRARDPGTGQLENDAVKEARDGRSRSGSHWEGGSR